VRAYGPGVEPTGPVVAAPANFIVETFSAGKGNVQVTVKDPRGQSIPVQLSFQAYYLSNFGSIYIYNHLYVIIEFLK